MKKQDLAVILVVSLAVMSGVIPAFYWFFNDHLTHIQVYKKFIPMNVIFIGIIFLVIKRGFK